MRACYHIVIETPKGLSLNGLWFGPQKPKKVIVWVHGLGSSAFSKLGIVDELVDASTAVITFNNRGAGKVSSTSSGRNKRMRGGAAHEKFTECVDDIEGAVRYAKQRKVKDVFLAGHSTGCQKSVHWATKKNGVKGIVLLAPVSDYAATVMLDGKRKIDRALAYAMKLVQKKRGHELLPESIWQWSLLADAQRFLSMYAGKGAEEIFLYWDPKRDPKALRSVKVPLLVLLAEKDEYADRPAAEMADWFRAHVRISKNVHVIPQVEHGFIGGEKQVASIIKQWSNVLS